MSMSSKKESKIKYPLAAAAVGLIHIALMLLNYYSTLAVIAEQFRTHNYSVIFPAVSQALAFVCVSLIFVISSAGAAFAVCVCFGILCTALMPAAYYSVVPVLMCVFAVKHILGKNAKTQHTVLLAAVMGIDICAALFATLTRGVTYLSVFDVESERKAAVIVCFLALTVLIAVTNIFAEKKVRHFLNKKRSIPFLLIFAVTLGAFTVSVVAFGENGQLEYVSVTGYIFASIYLLSKLIKPSEKKQ